MDWLIAVKTCSALNASWALRGRQIQARRRAGPIIANAKQLSRRVEGSGAPTAFVVAPAVLMFAKTAAEPALANEDLNLVEGNSREAQIGRIGIVERRVSEKGSTGTPLRNAVSVVVCGLVANAITADV